nr:transposase, Ptta/En/Spm [Tanacetum cinerariifolium]
MTFTIFFVLLTLATAVAFPNDVIHLLKPHSGSAGHKSWSQLLELAASSLRPYNETLYGHRPPSPQPPSSIVRRRLIQVVERKTFGSDVVFRIKCPCSKCKIKVFKKRDEVKFDSWHNGFIRGYTSWYAHGERKCRRAEIEECSEPIEEDNVVGCTQLILDIHNTTYLHQDTQEEQAPNSFAKQYYEMLEADDKPLYEGCQKFSTLEAATRLLNWKSKCNVPEATYNRALSLLKDMLPGGNKLVRNFYDTKKIPSKLDLPREKIHACKNCCMLFYGKVDSFLTKCKVYGHSRYWKGGRNNVPNLVLTYFSIAPRLQRIRSGGRGRGISGNISIGGGSNVFGFRNQDADYDNGSRSGVRGRGRSRNIGGRGSSTSGSGNPDADFDTNDNETETKTSRTCFAEPHVTRDIISIFKVMFYGPWATWREVDKESRDYMFEEFQDLYQWHLSENAAVYKAWERVMSSRYSGDGIHQDGKKSNVARQNRLTEVDGEVSKHTAGSKTILQHKFQMEKEKKQPVSLLEAYHRTHTSTNVSSEASGSGMNEASEGRTGEYVIASSKRVDVVEAAIVENHGPDASEHPPNDFDLWGEATGGEEEIVDLGTRGDQMVMVTRTTTTSSSSSTSNE